MFRKSESNVSLVLKKYRAFGNRIKRRLVWPLISVTVIRLLLDVSTVEAVSETEGSYTYVARASSGRVEPRCSGARQSSSMHLGRALKRARRRSAVNVHAAVLF